MELNLISPVKEGQTKKGSYDSPTGIAAPTPFRRIRSLLLGLPCVNCRAYYSSELVACPVCRYPKRRV